MLRDGAKNALAHPELVEGLSTNGFRNLATGRFPEEARFLRRLEGWLTYIFCPVQRDARPEITISLQQTA